MGSLMAGWGSKSATLKRTHSLTREEIDAFWKSKKEIEEDHLSAISNNLSQTIQANKNKGPEKLQKSTSMPTPSLDKHDWWTKSKWAFLNEPPITEAAPNKYASQFHVANMGSSKNAGISG